MDGDDRQRNVVQLHGARLEVTARCAVPIARVGGPQLAPQVKVLEPTIHGTIPALNAAPEFVNETQTADDILARHLMEQGHLIEADCTAAQADAVELDLPLARVLLTRGKVDEHTLLDALSTTYKAPVFALGDGPPDPRLAHVIPRSLALKAEAVPWRTPDGRIVIATARPDLFDQIKARAKDDLQLSLALATRADILAAQTRGWGAALARLAETQAPVDLSCRTWPASRMFRYTLALAAIFLTLEIFFPSQVALAAFALAGVSFTANISLKVAAFVAMLLRPPPATETLPGSLDDEPPFVHAPIVSLLVPMFEEPEIAERLISHLSQLRYPRERLDILLLLEEEDQVTARAIAATDLPPFMRVITVPKGRPQTKPRALNYALPFARGEIIGIYDAEDRPDHDQIAKVVRRFDEVPPDVVCLQGRLDYYNTDHNLMARLFAVEYASWFRVLLPGVQRLRLFVPLGGTTLFLRRKALEEVGGWDAHNVTEDAELGLRLARAGYRTELVDTTTYEEATAAVGPWIRQRSRWLKGYLITWATAMRTPMALWRNLGTWRFVGLQAQMFTAVLGFFLAPLLWSLVVVPFGLPHPLTAYLEPHHFAWIGAYMMLSLILSIVVSVHACATPHLRSLRHLAPVVELYYTLGTFAAWIGAFELLARPFFWAKTRHGVYGGLAKPEE